MCITHRSSQARLTTKKQHEAGQVFIPPSLWIEYRRLEDRYAELLPTSEVECSVICIKQRPQITIYG